MKKHILITGMAGCGKSTLAEKFEELGYETYNIEDIDGMFRMYRKGTDELFTDFDNADPKKIHQSEWRCNISKLRGLIKHQKTELAFYCGVGSNMDDIIPLFDKVFLLHVSGDTLRKRLKSREGTDDMGNTEESRGTVLGWKDWWENEMIQKGAVVVDAEKSPEEIAKEIISLAIK